MLLPRWNISRNHAASKARKWSCIDDSIGDFSINGHFDIVTLHRCRLLPHVSFQHIWRNKEPGVGKAVDMLLVLNAIAIKIARYDVQMQGRQGRNRVITKQDPMLLIILNSTAVSATRCFGYMYGRSNGPPVRMKFTQVIQMSGRNEVANAIDVAQWRMRARDEEEMLACLVVLIIKANVGGSRTAHNPMNRV